MLYRTAIPTTEIDHLWSTIDYWPAGVTLNELTNIPASDEPNTPTITRGKRYAVAAEMGGGTLRCP